MHGFLSERPPTAQIGAVVQKLTATPKDPTVCMAGRIACYDMGTDLDHGVRRSEIQHT